MAILVVEVQQNKGSLRNHHGLKGEIMVVKNASKPHIQSLEIKRNQNQNERKIKRKEK